MDTNENISKDWSYTVISQGNTRSQKRGLEEILAQCLLREYGPAYTLILDFKLQNVRQQIAVV